MSVGIAYILLGNNRSKKLYNYIKKDETNRKMKRYGFT